MEHVQICYQEVRVEKGILDMESDNQDLHLKFAT